MLLQPRHRISALPTDSVSSNALLARLPKTKTSKPGPQKQNQSWMDGQSSPFQEATSPVPSKRVKADQQMALWCQQDGPGLGRSVCVHLQAWRTLCTGVGVRAWGDGTGGPKGPES